MPTCGYPISANGDCDLIIELQRDNRRSTLSGCANNMRAVVVPLEVF
jgi:hypothetical protein